MVAEARAPHRRPGEDRLKLAVLGLLLAASAASAQAPARPGGAPLEMSYRNVYVGSGRLREGGRDTGTVEEQRQELRLEARRPFGEEARLTFGAFYRRAALDLGAGELVPDTLQLFRAAFGYERTVSSGWRVAAQVAPSLGGDRTLDARGFSLAGSVIATSLGDPRRTWVAGFGVDPRGPIPVVPFFGAILRPWDDWTVRLLLPELGVARKTGLLLGGKSEVKAGVKLSGGGYRVSPSFGSARGRPELDSRWLREQTLSAETGLTLEWFHMRAELSAGWAFLRRYEYREAGVRITAAAAPVVGLGLTGRF
ncbi:MAG: hypothetical protein PHS14_17430 [Elusimicrobia bacterium]|nr:hypothetical protein [Elusimicrobiota bacterium]